MNFVHALNSNSVHANHSARIRCIKLAYSAYNYI